MSAGRRDAPPPLTLSGPDGRRVTIDLAAGRAHVGELADVLGMPRRAVVLVDGRPVDRRVRLDRSGIATGSRVTCRSTRVACRAERDVDATGDRRAGGHASWSRSRPDRRLERSFALPPGRHLVGRSATCAVRLDDDLAELHHAVLDVRPVPGRVSIDARPTRRPRAVLVGRRATSGSAGCRAATAASGSSSRSAPAASASPLGAGGRTARHAGGTGAAARRPLAAHPAPTAAATAGVGAVTDRATRHRPGARVALGRRAACRGCVGGRWRGARRRHRPSDVPHLQWPRLRRRRRVGAQQARRRPPAPAAARRRVAARPGPLRRRRRRPARRPPRPPARPPPRRSPPPCGPSGELTGELWSRRARPRRRVHRVARMGDDGVARRHRRRRPARLSPEAAAIVDRHDRARRRPRDDGPRTRAVRRHRRRTRPAVARSLVVQLAVAHRPGGLAAGRRRRRPGRVGVGRVAPARVVGRRPRPRPDDRRGR